MRVGCSTNLQMVEEGQAVVYRDYLSACADTQDQFLEAEEQAKQQRLAFWNQDYPILPADFRRGETASESTQTSTSSTSPDATSSSASDTQTKPLCTESAEWFSCFSSVLGTEN